MKKKRISRRTFIKGAGTVGLAVSTIGFPAILRSATKMEEVEIGFIYPLSGHTAVMGNWALKGWNLAVDEINKAGGIKSLGGAKIKTVLGDTQSVPRVGMAEVEKVARNKNVPVVVGCYQSAVTFPATQIAEQYGLPFIVDISTQPAICRRGFKYVFRPAPPSDLLNERAVDFIEDMGKQTGFRAKRVAILGIDDNYGRSSSEDFKNAIKKKTEQEIVEEIYYPVKVTSVDVEIAKIKAANVDVIYLTSYLVDASLITRALFSQKVNTFCNISGGAGYIDPKFLEMVGPLANYLCAGNMWSGDKEFTAKMKKHYNVQANQNMALPYGALYVIKDVLERAGTVDRNKVRDAIAATHITSGPAMVIPGKFIAFDERGENIGCEPTVNQCLDGAYRTVWPIESKSEYKPVYPQPKREDR